MTEPTILLARDVSLELDGRPTFDEWYSLKHGATFDELWQQEGQRIWTAMNELSRALREYVSEMVQ